MKLKDFFGRTLTEKNLDDVMVNWGGFVSNLLVVLHDEGLNMSDRMLSRAVETAKIPCAQSNLVKPAVPPGRLMRREKP